ncbi:MAG: tetrahydromethanopterin S-methyltransferase subunit H family protein [Candidatus Odinarchaeia archaeon]
MYSFESDQKRFRIGKIEVGGHPGERPVVLVGSLFYLGHKLITSTTPFKFDKDKALELLNTQDEFSNKTGNPSMIDLIISSPEAVESEITFVADHTEAPILLDAVGFETKTKAINFVEEIGLKNNIVFNSITIESSEEELSLLKDSGIDSSILLAFSSKAFSTKARVETIKKLVEKTSDFIKKPFIDTYVLDIPSLGMACKAMSLLKYGCSSWRRLHLIWAN